MKAGKGARLDNLTVRSVFGKAFEEYADALLESLKGIRGFVARVAILVANVANDTVLGAIGQVLIVHHADLPFTSAIGSQTRRLRGDLRHGELETIGLLKARVEVAAAAASIATGHGDVRASSENDKKRRDEELHA